jgi:hypothetical protein
MSFVDVTLADPEDAEKRFKECEKCNKFKDKTEDKKQECTEVDVELHTRVVFKHEKCPLDKWVK